MSFWDPFGEPRGTSGVILTFRFPPKALSKRFYKLIEISVILAPPAHRGRVRQPPPGSPGSKKRTFLAKVAISLQRGANFQFLDFGTPLEKSISLPFSEQWLCHFSRRGSGGPFPPFLYKYGFPDSGVFVFFFVFEFRFT